MKEEDLAPNPNDNFWETTFKEAYDEKGNFLNRYEDSVRSYPKQDILGQGGVKTIYKSFDWKTEREVALAVPKDESNHEVSEEFIHEAITLGKLEHPNIIPVYDTGLDEQKIPYYTMKFVDGENLESYSQKLFHRHNFSTNLPSRLDIFKKVCLAVAYAHSRNIVHLDIKPSNVIIGKFGEVFLCDWGLSQEINHLTSSIHFSKLNGTPGYIAPERLEKTSPTITMDIYSLGCLFYYLLSNKNPIENTKLTLFIDDLKEHNIKPLEEVSHHPVPNSLIQIFEKCIQKDPSLRYTNVNEIIEDLDLYTNGYATKAEQAGLYRNAVLLYKRNLLACNLIIAFILVIASTTTLYIDSLKEKTRIAIEEKDRSEKLAKTLNQKNQENEQFIDQLIETADRNFRKSRLDSTQRILEDILSMPLKQDEVQFRLAQISIGQFKWIKAQRCLDTMKTKHPEALVLQDIINQYKELPDSIENHYQLSLKAYQAGFFSLYNNLSSDLIKKSYEDHEKHEHILHFLRLDNQFDDGVDLSFNKDKKELIIKNTEVSKFRMMVALELDTLKLLNCNIIDSLSSQFNLQECDLRNSTLDGDLKVNLSQTKFFTLPSNKLKLDFREFSMLKKLTLPNKIYKESEWKKLKDIVHFY